MQEDNKIIETKEVNITDLKAHPRNEKIYGQEDVSDLIGLISESGEIDRLIVNPDYVIISGHRRWLAAQELGYETLPCEIIKFESPEDEREALIRHNIARDKTNEQRTREGMELEAIISERSKERKVSKLKQRKSDMDKMTTSDDSLKENVSENTNDETGTTRDIVARAVKISSGKKYERCKKVIEKADKCKSEGKKADSELLIILLNKSPNAAHQLVTKADFDSLSDEQKNELINGEIAPRSLVPDETKAQKSTNETSPLDEVKTLKTNITTLGKSISNIKTEKQRESVKTQIEKQIENLQNMLSMLQAVEKEKESDEKSKET